MNRETSIYLDVLRFSSALLVLLAHFSIDRFSSDYLDIFNGRGHVAVIIFFVLSGYVISYITDTKEKNIKSYMISRFARLYSVIIPVLIIVAFLDYSGQLANAEVYEGKTSDSGFLISLLANLFFLQEVWGNSLRYLSNGPLWSLGYEFWYYILFAVFVFVRGVKKYAFIVIISLMVGPKILLLMVPWLFGVWVYDFHKNKILNTMLARFCFFLSPVVLALMFTFFHDINMFVRDILGSTTYDNLGYSKRFITDYIAAAIVGLNILSFKYIKLEMANDFLVTWEGVVRFFANSTFTIYLLHFPLFLFFAATLNHNPKGLLDVFILLTVTLLTCVVIAQFTEKKKYVFKKQISRIWDRIELRFK